MTIAHVLIYALLPAAALLIGGVAALWRAPSPALRSGILHFAAGVVFAVVAVELLPNVVRRHAPVEIGIGFGAGVALMLGIRFLEQRLEGDGAPSSTDETNHPDGGLPAEPVPQRLPMGLLVGVGVDILVDGLLLGIGFAAGAKEGLLLTLALTGELTALGLATTASLRAQGFGRRIAFGLTAGLAFLFLVGGAAGATLLQNLSQGALEVVLSFGVAALLFLVTEELLVEAHEAKETPLLTATFFAGFLLFLLLSMSG